MNSPYIVTYQEEEKPKKPDVQYIFLAMLMIFSVYLYTKIQALERKTASVLAAKVALATTTPQNTISPTPTSQPYDLIPEVTDKDHVRGNINNAKVVLIEYSDLECPFCKKFDPVMKQVLKEYDGKVAWVYRHYPLPFHENAQKEAEASECAADLGGNITFWNYIDAIIDRTTSNGKGFALEKLVPLAEELGLDGNRFKTCLDRGTYEQKIKQEKDDASLGGISGTPTTIIIPVSGKRDIISGAISYEQIKQQLDQILE